MTATISHQDKSFRRLSHHRRAHKCLLNGHFLTKDMNSNSRWLVELEEEKVQVVILDRYRDVKLLQLLQDSPNWTVDFADAQSMILVRTN